MSDAELEVLRAFFSKREWPLDIAGRRRLYDENANRFPLPDDIEAKTTTISDVPVEWTWAPGARRDRTIIYLHGGGYVYGSLRSHRHLASEIGRAADMGTIAIDYRLAPEHPFPAPIHDVLSVYRALLEAHRPGHIAIVGDSAGAGLAVAAMQAFRDEGLPQPACAWLISPFVDMAAKGRSYVGKAAIDPVVGRETIEFVADAYLNGADPTTPLASPIHADLREVAPLLIFAGSHEVLMDDSVELCRAAGAADVSVRLEIWPRMIHIWPSYHQVLSEGRRAIETGAAFVNAAMADIAAAPSSRRA
jgi:monoterpene epsilon-lactone hydrolase